MKNIKITILFFLTIGFIACHPKVKTDAVQENSTKRKQISQDSFHPEGERQVKFLDTISIDYNEHKTLLNILKVLPETTMNSWKWTKKDRLKTVEFIEVNNYLIDSTEIYNTIKYIEPNTLGIQVVDGFWTLSIYEFKNNNFFIVTNDIVGDGNDIQTFSFINNKLTPTKMINWFSEFDAELLLNGSPNCIELLNEHQLSYDYDFSDESTIEISSWALTKSESEDCLKGNAIKYKLNKERGIFDIADVYWKEKKNDIPSDFKSELRPNEKIELGKIYSDTVGYLEFNDEGDEWMFIVGKDNSTIGLVYNNEQRNEFIRGSKIVIQWKMDSIRYAGDSEFLSFTEFLISYNNVKLLNQTDEEVEILWRANQYDEAFGTDINTIILNDGYIINMSEPERAALAYVATFIGNECEWDGGVNEDRSNLKCKILTSLNLGYQCSDKHYGFLKKWFSKDTDVLKKLERCRKMPNTATVQTTFNEISMFTEEKNKTIDITYKVQGINVREDSSWSWTQTDKFEYNSENITLVNSEKIDDQSEDKLGTNHDGYTNELATYAKIDSVSIKEIKRYSDTKLPTIYDYYSKEVYGEYSTWSDKLFGRCCTEADLLYSELLEFDITASVNNSAYPSSNLSDTEYRTAYAFKENEDIEIALKLKRNNDSHEYFTNLKVDEVLKSNDILLNPFKLSVINGYVKSKQTFNENGKVKEMKVYLNDSYKGTVLLLNTPLVQEFEMDFAFSKNDTIKLIPISFYEGSKYDDICISEIQSSLAHIIHPSINKKYEISELYEKGSALKNKN